MEALGATSTYQQPKSERIEILILHTAPRPHGIWPPENKKRRSTIKTPKSSSLIKE
jgi:hypothetical protein